MLLLTHWVPIQMISVIKISWVGLFHSIILFTFIGLEWSELNFLVHDFSQQTHNTSLWLDHLHYKKREKNAFFHTFESNVNIVLFDLIIICLIHPPPLSAILERYIIDWLIAALHCEDENQLNLEYEIKMMLHIFPLFVHIRWSAFIWIWLESSAQYKRISSEISIANYDTHNNNNNCGLRIHWTKT